MKISTPTIFTNFISPTDPDLKVYVNRIIAAGGTINSQHKAAIATFMSALKSANLWSLCTLLAPLAGDNLTSAKVPLKSPVSTNFTSDSDPGYALGSGAIYTNGSEMLATKIIANQHLGLTDFAIWAYSSTVNPVRYSFLIGESGTFGIELVSANSGDLPQASVNRASSIAPPTAPTQKNGLYGGISNLGGQSLWLNGVQLAQAATATVPLTASELQIGRRQNVTLTHANPFSVGFAAVTTALSPAQVVAFNNAVVTMMTAMGR
jgi:hypothetical protein